MSQTSNSTTQEPPPLNHLAERFTELKQQVLVKKPVLAEIMKKRGDKNLYDYALDYIDVNVKPAIERRQKEFIDTFKKEVTKQLGKTVAASAAEQITKYYYVSTTDHHGPICHPFFINANLIASTPYVKYLDPVLSNLIVLSNSNVSLNNSSFPRGLLFHSKADQGKIIHRLAFSACQSRLCPVYNFQAYTALDIERAKKQLAEKLKEQKILKQEYDTILGLVEDVYCHEDVLNCDTFSLQITKTNYLLWKKFFYPNNRKVPNLLYIEQEGLVAELLLAHHLEENTAINHILFDDGYDPLISSYFDGIDGAFSKEKNWGSYFFWALPKGHKYRLQLWKKGNFLESADGAYQIELRPDTIREALQKRELIPGMMLCYILLCFYYGLKCLGGFSQVNYLTFMKNAYIKMQADRGNYKSIEMCARAQTKEMCGDVALAFLGLPDGSLTPATGLDLILHGSEYTWPKLVELSKLITLEEALNPMMPEFYRIVYAEDVRKSDLNAVTAEEIVKLTGLDKKMKACAYLNGNAA